VKEFAREEGLVYAEFGFVEGNKEVVGVLRGVSEQVRLIGRVAEGQVQAMMGRADKKTD
jgi:delta8-fatty-acid desaturase